MTIEVDTAIEGTVLSPRVQKIIKLEQGAEWNHWEAARLISEELADGKSQRQLANEIGKSHTHVQHMAKAWEWQLKLPPSDRPPFNELYNSPEVRGQSAAKPKSVPPAEPPPSYEPEPSTSVTAEPAWTSEPAYEPEPSYEPPEPVTSTPEPGGSTDPWDYHEVTFGSWAPTIEMAYMARLRRGSYPSEETRANLLRHIKDLRSQLSAFERMLNEGQ
jgi:hypothetical protein